MRSLLPRSPRATLVAGLLGLLLVAAAAWLLAVGPATDRLAETRVQHEDTVDANLLLTTRLHAAQRQREELSTTVRSATDLAALFPASADQPDLFRMIDEAAVTAGIDPDDVTALSPTVPATASDPAVEGDPATATTGALPADLAVQSVTVSVEAPYAKVEDLLDHLGRLDRAFLVRDVAVATVEGKTTAQIVGTVFLAPDLPTPEVTR